MLGDEQTKICRGKTLRKRRATKIYSVIILGIGTEHIISNCMQRSKYVSYLYWAVTTVACGKQRSHYEFSGSEEHKRYMPGCCWCLITSQSVPCTIQDGVWKAIPVCIDWGQIVEEEPNSWRKGWTTGSRQPCKVCRTGPRVQGPPGTGEEVWGCVIPECMYNVQPRLFL